MLRVNQNQKGNNLLNSLSKSQWYFDSSVEFDYQLNTIGILFLSLKYHTCKPDYIIKRMVKTYSVNQKILLILVDVKNYEILMEQLFANSYKYNYTIILGYSNEECAEYLKLIDTNLYKTNEILKVKKENIYDNFISLFPKVNKNDVLSIKNAFTNIKSFINSEEKTLCCVDGINKNKAELLIKYFNMPFKD